MQVRQILCRFEMIFGDEKPFGTEDREGIYICWWPAMALHLVLVVVLSLTAKVGVGC